MPTPQEKYLAHLRAGDGGGYVPKNAKDAEAEFERLTQLGMPELEAEALIVKRLRPGADNVGFGTHVYNNAAGLVGGVADAAQKFNGFRMVTDPAGYARDLGSAAGGMRDTLTRGMEKAREAEGLERAGGFAEVEDLYDVFVL